MQSKPIRIAIATVLIGAFAIGLSSTASAAVNTQTTAEIAANAAFANALAAAKAGFLNSVQPSRKRAVAVGLRAEAARRSSMKSALAAFDAVVKAEKAATLANEKSYKAAVAKLAATPANLLATSTGVSLKASVKTSLVALTNSSVALKSDAKIATARVAFAKARVTAMAKFKSAVAIATKERAVVQVRATAKYKALKVKALVNLQVALKVAKKTK